MGLMERVERGSLQSSVTFGPTDDFWYNPVGAATFAGFRVSPDTAMQVSTVFACVTLIAETLASLPLRLERVSGEDGAEKRLATDHPLYPVLTWRPNPRHSRFEFVRLLVQRMALWGNGYAEQRLSGPRLALIPLHPRIVTVEELAGYRLRYQIRPPNAPPYALSQDSMVHLRDGGDDETTGMARSVLAKQAIAVAAAAEAMAAGYFRNDATGRLVFTFPNALRDETRQQLREMIDKTVVGWQNTRRPMFVDNGGKVDALGGPDEAAFLVDPRNYQVQDICKFWRVWPYMIGHESKITWGTNIAETKQGYVDFTARPWGDGVEGALMRDLLSEEEVAEGYRIRFDYKPLLKGDLLSTVQALATQRQHGLLSPNEGRRILDMNPRDDPGGDSYQETPTGAAPNDPRRRATDMPAPRQPPPAEEEQALDLAPFIGDAAARISAAEVREVEKKAEGAKQEGGRWLTWTQKFYGEHRRYAVKVVQPLVKASGLEPWVAETIGERVESSALAALPFGVPAGWAEGRQAEVEALIREALTAGAAVRRAA